jgi:hypothetical protein
MEAARKVMSVLTADKFSPIITLDDNAKAAIAKTMPVEAVEPKVRKVRDSKLQRMAAAFRELVTSGNEKGQPHAWSIQELMERCGTSELQTHVYISILRNPKDRFVMNIMKDTETKRFALSV